MPIFFRDRGSRGSSFDPETRDWGSGSGIAIFFFRDRGSGSGIAIFFFGIVIGDRDFFFGIGVGAFLILFISKFQTIVMVPCAAAVHHREDKRFLISVNLTRRSASILSSSFMSRSWCLLLLRVRRQYSQSIFPVGPGWTIETSSRASSRISSIRGWLSGCVVFLFFLKMESACGGHRLSTRQCLDYIFYKL